MRHLSSMLLIVLFCGLRVAFGQGAAAPQAEGTGGAGEGPPAEAPPPFETILFDGHDLDRWVISGCEAVVEDGLLVLKSGNGWLRTHHRHANFELELSWRPRKGEAWDSGILFRAGLPRENRPWPDRYQVNLRQGLEGELVRTSARPPAGLVRPGDWNHFRLRVVGRTARLEVNGQLAWEYADLEPGEGYLGLQSEVPGGGEFEFKEIRLKELDHLSLFNGRDLSGWEAASGEAAECWQVEHELLLCNGRKGTWLRSCQPFADFNLRLEYRLLPGGNSGVYIRVPAGGQHHGEDAGIEIQILDDEAERYRELKPYQFTGSLYALVAAEPRVSRPAGRWNTLEIDCRGGSYRVTHNGVEVIRANAADDPLLAERRVEGFLGLQNHSEEVAFRYLRIGPPQ